MHDCDARLYVVVGTIDWREFGDEHCPLRLPTDAR
jgi:hypothetical protein